MPEINDLASLGTATRSQAGKPLHLLHPQSGEPLTCDGKPMLLYVAGGDSPAYRQGVQAAARATLRTVEEAMARVRAEFSGNDRFKRLPSDQQEAEVRQRAEHEVYLLLSVNGSDLHFERMCGLYGHMVTGWDGIVFNGSSEFTPANLDALLHECPWILEQVGAVASARADFLEAPPPVALKRPAGRSGSKRSTTST